MSAKRPLYRTTASGRLLPDKFVAICYGAQPAKITIGGRDAYLEQVKAGFAWHYKEYEKEQQPSDRTIYA